MAGPTSTATLPIPLFSRTYKNVDETVLTDDAALQYNGFIDELSGLNIRPGEVLAINTTFKNDGLYFWPDKNYIVCVDNQVVTLRIVSGETLITSKSGGSVSFAPGQRVIFCNNDSLVFMAGGGKINYVDTLGLVFEITDPDAPTTVTHVVFLDGYLLAITGDSNKFYWSNVSDNTNWSALNFASAEGNPDIIQAMHVVQRQLYLLGTVTTEIWENDGTTPFSRIPGGLIQIGCIAKYSPIIRGNSLIWLSHTRQFVEFTGTNIKFLSSRYEKEIANFAVVSDCIGGYVLKDGQEYYIFQFPSEGRTLVYNPNIDDWSEWANWNSSSMSWVPYDFRSSVYDIQTGKTFIGKEDAALIACLSSDSQVDLTSGSTSRPFKFFRRTGFISHGNNKIKRVESLRFRAKRGNETNPDNPTLMLRYRNDGSSQWSNIREIDLGSIGETPHHIELYRLGTFKSRQYEISATDSVPIVLSNAEIEVTILR